MGDPRGVRDDGSTGEEASVPIVDEDLADAPLARAEAEGVEQVRQVTIRSPPRPVRVPYR